MRLSDTPRRGPCCADCDSVSEFQIAHRHRARALFFLALFDFVIMRSGALHLRPVYQLLYILRGARLHPALHLHPSIVRHNVLRTARHAHRPTTEGITAAPQRMSGLQSRRAACRCAKIDEWQRSANGNTLAAARGLASGPLVRGSGRRPRPARSGHPGHAPTFVTQLAAAASPWRPPCSVAARP